MGVRYEPARQIRTRGNSIFTVPRQGQMGRLKSMSSVFASWSCPLVSMRIFLYQMTHFMQLTYLIIFIWPHTCLNTGRMFINRVNRRSTPSIQQNLYALSTYTEQRKKPASRSETSLYRTEEGRVPQITPTGGRAGGGRDLHVADTWETLIVNAYPRRCQLLLVDVVNPRRQWQIELVLYLVI